jgi:RNA polymerase sigma-70 factor, ECF subfamily
MVPPAGCRWPLVRREGPRIGGHGPFVLPSDHRRDGPARAVISFGVHDRGMANGPSTVDTKGLRQAYLAYGGELLGYARKSLGDPQLAEEVVQETFERAWRFRSSFRPDGGAMRGWLFAIERRVLIDQYRRGSAHPAQPLDGDVAAPEDEIERAMVGWQVEEAIRRLRPEHREVLVNIYFGRRTSSRELAEQLSIPEGTVRSRLFYALRSLRLTLDEMGWES